MEVAVTTERRRRRRTSPMRTLEMLEGRFGAFEALAYASLTITRHSTNGETHAPMDGQTANAILEFADDLRRARRSATQWARAEGLIPTSL